ncbi:hypothetical protein E2F47_09260 [Mycobacterium eburneum]|nr:hypothetical protein [Mycobacterium eburneum]TDH55895.1 hypothetical protein E2F47_09260 [Mycobacterium eburneum]
MKPLAVTVAAVAAIGGAFTGAAVGTPAPAHAHPAVFNIPLPRDPAPNSSPAQELPTAEQITRILTELTDPGVADQAKGGLVQGGINSAERRAFSQRRLDKAADHGELPLAFSVGKPWSVGPNTAAAETTISGPKLPVAVTPVLTFVKQGEWMLSNDGAAKLIQAVAGD